MNKNKVTTEELVAWFWKMGGAVESRDKVNVDFHEDTLVNVSVMLRNEQEGVETMVRICVDFDPVQDFIDAFDIVDVRDVAEIGLEDLLVLYQKGIAYLDVVKERVG